MKTKMSIIILLILNVAITCTVFASGSDHEHQAAGHFKPASLIEPLGALTFLCLISTFILGQKKTKNQFLVGFAAETNDLEKNALLKIEKKNLDMIAANHVGSKDSGFKADTNKVKLFSKDGTCFNIPLMEKDKVANILIDQIIEKME